MLNVFAQWFISCRTKTPLQHDLLFLTLILADFPSQTAGRHSECLSAVSRLLKQASASTRSSSPLVRYCSNTSRSKLSLIWPMAPSSRRDPASFWSVAVVAPNAGPCVISVCRLLRPGVSAGLLPPLCQQQAAGDALSLPLPFRWDFLLLLPCKPGQSCALFSFFSRFSFHNMQISFEHSPLRSECPRNQRSPF